jgi:hypothetical protein
LAHAPSPIFLPILHRPSNTVPTAKSAIIVAQLAEENDDDDEEEEEEEEEEEYEGAPSRFNDGANDGFNRASSEWEG